MPESLSIITELGIGLAGFSGVVAALGYRGNRLAPIDRFRVMSLLVASLGAALFAALPLAIADAYGPSPAVWRVSSAAFAVYLGGWFVYSLRTWITGSEDIMPYWHPAMTVAGLGGIPVLGLALAANAAGWRGEPSAGPYLAGLLFLLVGGCLQFVRLLLVRPVDPPPPD